MELTVTQSRKVSIGEVYAHFKRELYNIPKISNEYLYCIQDIAQHTETGEALVIYKALYPPYTTYARPLVMFLSKTDKKKYPTVKQEYRFMRVFPSNEANLHKEE